LSTGFTVTINHHYWIPTAVYPRENGGRNDRKVMGMKEGKSPVGTTLRSNTEITPEIIWGYFYFNIKFFLGGGGTNFSETHQQPRYREKWSVSTYPSTQINSTHSPCLKVITTDSPAGASAKYKVNVPSTFISGPNW